MEDKNTAILIPYFGKVPSGFELWLKGASYNDKIDFHLIGDCFENIKKPRNVFIHDLSFDSLKHEIRRSLGARSLDSPYKLCDFKPSYGVLFRNIVEGYKIWGFSDLDLFLGDLCKTINFDTIPSGWGRIFDYGHLSFFPNIPEVTHAFEQPLCGVDTWKFVKNSRIIWVYDEHYYKGFGGVNGRLEKAGFRVESLIDHFSDVQPQFCGFFDRRVGPSSNLIYYWDKGRIWKIWNNQGEIRKSELSYVHIQKRDIRIQWVGENAALLIPRHWPAPATLEEGLALLEPQFAEDILLRPAYAKRQKLIKLKKCARFFVEVAIIPNGLPSLTLLFRNYSYKR